MGKLNIAHHKSYHPYRLDNIERVKRDEEEARLKEENEEGRMALANSEARIQLLREKAGLNKKKKSKEREKDEIPIPTVIPEAPPLQLSDSKHINLFEDLEQQAMSANIVASQRARQKTKEAEQEKGVALAPSEKDRNPWYTTESGKNSEHENLTGQAAEIENERQARDLSHKSFNDPLTSIHSYYSKRDMTSNDSRSYRKPPPRPPPNENSSDPLSNRLSREKSERERALELVRRRKREMEGMQTPMSSVDGRDSGYKDVFNRKETEDARRRWRGGRERYGQVRSW